MPWGATFKGAQQDGANVNAVVTFTKSEDGQAFDKVFTFGPGDALTKANLKSQVVPVLDTLNTALTKITQSAALVGQDITTW